MRHSFPRGRKKLFDPNAREPFRVSRSKIDLFFECPRCFYLDARLGVSRPSMPGFALNIAVDHLLKKEFDTYRAKRSPHPLMESYGIDATPFQHPKLDDWRNNFRGVQVLHEPTNILVFGAVDDIWITPAEELYVVDYKATSKSGEIDLESGWGPQYKRQLEVYQWLLRGNGLAVSNIGYFVYANGIKDKEGFDNKLEFKVEVISHRGSDSWVEPTVEELHRCLLSEETPSVGERCEYCPYREHAGRTLLAKYKKQSSGKEPKRSAAYEGTGQLF